LSTKQPTIRDVARLSGTSIASVSRVLNKKDYPVSAELRARIEKAVAELDYHPNWHGRSLRQRWTEEIGIVVPGLVNPFYGELMEAAHRACLEAGLFPSIHSSDGDPAREQELIRGLLQRQAGGLLLSPTCNSEVLEQELDGHLPLVLFDQTLGDGGRWPAVHFDFVAGGRLAGDHLLATGHRRIALISPDFSLSSRRLIRKGLAAAIARAQSASSQTIADLEIFTAVNVGSPAATTNQFALEVAHMLAMHPDRFDALVTVNDLLAASLLHALQTLGFAVPRDISLLSFDNTILASLVKPELTAVHQDATRTAELAVELLVAARAGEAVSFRHIIPTLIQRDSVSIRRDRRTWENASRSQGSAPLTAASAEINRSGASPSRSQE